LLELRLRQAGCETAQAISAATSVCAPLSFFRFEHHLRKTVGSLHAADHVPSISGERSHPITKALHPSDFVRRTLATRTAENEDAIEATFADDPGAGGPRCHCCGRNCRPSRRTWRMWCLSLLARRTMYGCEGQKDHKELARGDLGEAMETVSGDALLRVLLP
jgi:hypothetical protein